MALAFISTAAEDVRDHYSVTATNLNKGSRQFFFFLFVCIRG